MEIGFDPQVAFIAGAGIVGGLWLLLRGMRGYRTATRIGDTSTSRLATLAAGEVQVSGVIEPAELTLVSPLQSASCVYYRATIDRAGEYPDLSDEFLEERAVGFRIRDASGDVRVFPRGARWDAPTRYDDSTGMMGDEPPGLTLRTGPAIAAADPDGDAAITAQTSVPRIPEFDPLAYLGGGMRDSSGLGSGGVGATARPGSSPATRSRSSGGHSPSRTSPTRPKRTSPRGPSPRTIRRSPGTSLRRELPAFWPTPPRTPGATR